MYPSGMQAGRTPVPPSGDNTITCVTVTFYSPFSSVPALVVTPNFSNSSGALFVATVERVTEAGATVNVGRLDGSTWSEPLEVHWAAFGIDTVIFGVLDVEVRALPASNSSSMVIRWICCYSNLSTTVSNNSCVV
jgi:hypothetical protein